MSARFSSTQTYGSMFRALLRGDVRAYLGLRTSDPSYLMPDGKVFHPSKGTEGSVYVTTDGTPYLRTSFGNRKLPKQTGAYILNQQHRGRRSLAWKRGLTTAVLIALAIAGAVVLL